MGRGGGSKKTSLPICAFFGRSPSKVRVPQLRPPPTFLFYSAHALVPLESRCHLPRQQSAGERERARRGSAHRRSFTSALSTVRPHRSAEPPPSCPPPQHHFPTAHMVGASLLLIPQLLFSPPASPPRHALHAATLLRRAEPPLELPAALARERGAAQALPYLLRRRGAPLRMQAVAPPPTRAASPSGTSSGAPGTGRTRDAAVSDDAMRW